VKQKTPFLSGFSTHLFGCAKGKTQDILSRQRRDLITGTLDLQQQFLQEIDPHLLDLHSSTGAHSPLSGSAHFLGLLEPGGQ
jgi:hypothetical protein